MRESLIRIREASFSPFFKPHMDVVAFMSSDSSKGLLYILTEQEAPEALEHEGKGLVFLEIAKPIS